EVGGAVRSLGRGDAEVAELAVGGGGRLADHERQVASVETRPDELLQTGLPDRHLTPRQEFDAVGKHVGADDLVAQGGETGGGGEPHVPRPQHCDTTHELTSSFTSRSSGSW